ncbi:hypothetical protein FACHB389_00320 [Nostoc calcicola FACHB-389]|nr:hypothetical protein [Nostoc calcicola FACHB-3891]OKH42646.1 hypothetical protein FACHB389_00320 [Nostoc calcicola FACHB-389]
MDINQQKEGIAESGDDFYFTQRRKDAKNPPLAFIKNLNSSRIYAKGLLIILFLDEAAQNSLKLLSWRSWRSWRFVF